LDKIKDRPWYIQASTAQNGDGIYEGLDWMTTTIPKFKKHVTDSKK
jgi:hypothetical protein